MTSSSRKVIPQGSSHKDKIIFLVGPTASGKTDVGLSLAKKLRAEIISCDSMQVYKGMDIITAKPDKAALKKVSHHLIGVVSPQAEYDVSRYRQSALKLVKKIIDSGKTPLFVGGTGLYMAVLLDGIFDQEAKDERVRNKLYKLEKGRGKAYLYKRLSKADPVSAAKIHPNDVRRIVRALEVFEITGKPISVLQKTRHGLRQEYDARIFCLNPERNALYSRINQRVESMFRKGLVKEVKKLQKAKLSKTASVAIGLKEVGEYLKGNCELNEAKELMKQASRQYAKRQLTWFRKDKQIHWINTRRNDLPEKIAERIRKTVNGKIAACNC